MPGKTRRSAIDWAAIRQRFEATSQREVSTRRIARDHGVSETAVRKKARAESWLRRDQRERLLYGDRSGLGAKVIDWPRSALSAQMPRAELDLERSSGGTTLHQQPMRRALLPTKWREGHKVSSEDLIDRLSHLAQSLVFQLESEIDRRNTVIKMIGERKPGAGGRMAAKYSVLQKEVDLKKLTTALLNLAAVYKIIANHPSDSRTKGATSGR